MTDTQPHSGHSYPVRVGLAVDEFLNALLFNGDPEQTVSYHSAVAAKEKKTWGCVMCKILDVVVERNHCAKQFAPVISSPLTALRASVAIGFVLLTLYGATHAGFELVDALIRP